MSQLSQPPHHEEHHSFDTSNAEGRWSWFFKEFWPIVLVGSFFLLMCALPLTLSGMMHNPFSASDVVWSGYGLLLLGEFILAIALLCLFPRSLGIYTLLLAIYSLVYAEQWKAWTVGNMPWGSSIAILFLTYVLIGNVVFMSADASSRKRRL